MIAFSTFDFWLGDFNDNPPNNFKAVKIATLLLAGALTDNGTAVAAGQFILASDISAGNLKFTPAQNVCGSNYASFTFQVQDDGGTANGGVDTDPVPKTTTHQSLVRESSASRYYEEAECSCELNLTRLLRVTLVSIDPEQHTAQQFPRRQDFNHCRLSDCWPTMGRRLRLDRLYPCRMSRPVCSRLLRQQSAVVRIR